jgi:hypothetical protein
MGEMTTMSKCKAHDFVAWLKKCSVNFKISGTSTQRLNIDGPFVWIQSESSECALLAKNLNLINKLVTAIIALAGKTLRVLICEA